MVVNEGSLAVNLVANMLEEALGKDGSSSEDQNVVVVENYSQTPNMLNGLFVEAMRYI